MLDILIIGIWSMDRLPAEGAYRSRDSKSKLGAVNVKYLFAVTKSECRSQRYFIFKVDQVYFE
jgi:hypothetical protein